MDYLGALGTQQTGQLSRLFASYGDAQPCKPAWGFLVHDNRYNSDC